MIYTSSFSQVSLLEAQGFQFRDMVGISRYECRDAWLRGLTYVKELAPSKKLLNGYKNGKYTWREFSYEFFRQMYNLEWLFWRDFVRNFDGKVLLCYEEKPDHCHRNLVRVFLNWFNCLPSDDNSLMTEIDTFYLLNRE